MNATRHAIMNAPRHFNPWFIGITVTLATFMEFLDTSIANVSLPHIAGSLGTTLDETTWILTSYLVANAVVLPLSAWLSRVFGRKNYYMTCVALFTAASLLCGLAPNLEMLILFRVLQGIAGGGLAPLEQAILVDTFPRARQVAAFGMYSMAVVLAPAVGPTLGGWITDNFSWRWVFFINVPVGILSLILTNQLVHDPPEFIHETKELRKTGKLRIDYLGIVLIALGLGCLQVVLDRGQEEDWFGSTLITVCIFLTVVALILAVVWELTQRDPVVDLSLIRERNFGLSLVFIFCFGFLLYGTTLLLPQFLQTMEGYQAESAGQVLAPAALLVLFMAPFVVRLTRKISAKHLLFFGFFVISVALWHFSRLDLTASYTTFTIARMLQSFGFAFLFVPINQIAYSYIPVTKNNKASSLTNLFRNEGGSFGIAAANTILARRAQFHLSTLVNHLGPDNWLCRDWLNQTTQHLAHAGNTLLEAARKGEAELFVLVNQQANLLSYLDCFLLFMIPAGVGMLCCVFVKQAEIPPAK